MSAKTISVRPPQRIEPKILQLAVELDKSPGQLMSDAAEAIIAMIESPTPHIPKIVTAARTLRANDATFAHPERAFPRVEVFEEEISSAKVAEEPSPRRSRNGRGK